MKVLFANKFFFLNGGSETVLFQERAYLLEQGVEVVDFAMRDERNFASPQAEYFAPPVSYRAGPLLGRLRAAAAFVHSREAVSKITALAQATGPDIAHLHNIYHQLTPSIIPALKKSGARVIMTLHDGKLICPAYLMLNRGKTCLDCRGEKFHLPFTRNCQGSRARGALLAAEAYYHKWRKSYEQVDLFITPSRFLAEAAAPRLGRDKLRVLRNGIDLGKYSPTWEDENYILYLGRLSAEKGVKTLLKAQAAMRPEYKARLLIVGAGPLEAELRALAPAEVVFAGHCSGDTLLDHVRKASCLVVPSEWYENCSMTVLEAMAMGKPVIGTRMGGLPEQVEDGVNGCLFEAGNSLELTACLERLMASPELRQRLGAAGRRKAEADFSLQGHNRELLKIYAELLER